MPLYELEGDGYSKKIIVNSIARFRLRLSSPQITTVDSFSLTIRDPYSHPIVVQRRVLSSDLLELTYQPMSIGRHQLSISYQHQLDRQINIDVVPEQSNFISKLRPFGPGLRRAIRGLPTEFYVDLNRTTNQNIHFRLEPSYQAEIDYEQQMATVRYIPTEDGDCPINILENDQDIPQSPFIAQVDQCHFPREKTRVRVIGLSKTFALHQPVEFQVFIENPLDETHPLLAVEILTDENYPSPPVTIRRRHRSSYICSFTPATLGRHWISVDYAGVVAEQNPFHCQAIQSKDILLIGPAINNPCLVLNQPTHFSFKLKDFQNMNYQEKSYTYESGYSSNDDISSRSSSSNDIGPSKSDDDTNYRVTITDGHGNIKSNVRVREMFDLKKENDIRVDFTPDEQILYINVSCTW